MLQLIWLQCKQPWTLLSFMELGKVAKDYVNIRLISIKVSSAKTEGQFKSLGILPLDKNRFAQLG